MSFKDTFTKGEKGEKNLEYDDTALYYFFISILTVISIPIFISLWKEFFKSDSKIFARNC